MIETILAACLWITPPTPAELTEYQSCRETEYVVYSVEKWIPLVQSYFAEEDVVRAFKVIYCESSGRPAVTGQNTDGTNDVFEWVCRSWRRACERRDTSWWRFEKPLTRRRMT